MEFYTQIKISVHITSRSTNFHSFIHIPLRPIYFTEQKTTLTELYKFYYKANGVGEELEMVVIPRLAKQWFKLGVNGFMLKEWEVNICQKPGADDEATCSELFQKFLRSGSKTYQCPILWKHIVEAINRADFKDCGTDLERALPFMVKK